MLAIAYSHRTTADPGLALQNHDIWTEAAFFATVCVVAALLVGSARKLLRIAAAILLSFLGLLAVGDIVNSRVLTASAIGLHDKRQNRGPPMRASYACSTMQAARPSWRERTPQQQLKYQLVKEPTEIDLLRKKGEARLHSLAVGLVEQIAGRTQLSGGEHHHDRQYPYAWT
jgi:hypothetical protein